MCWPVVKGFFLDVPRVIDFAWRHAEYRLNAECDHWPNWNGFRGEQSAGSIRLRPFWKKPAFWFFAITVFFTSYGPTWDGLCAIAPQSIMATTRHAVALFALIIGVPVLILVLLEPGVAFLIRERFNEARHNEHIEPPADLPLSRRFTCCAVIYFGLVLLAVAGVTGGSYLYEAAPGGLVCAKDEWNGTAIKQLLMCLAAIIPFAWLTTSDRPHRWVADWVPTRVKFNVLMQFLILAGIALIQWFILTTEDTRAASDLAYRHVFLLWAPCVALVMAVAPSWAHRRFRTIPDSTKAHFRRCLGNTELFVHPTDPPLSGRSILYAFVFGSISHLLHLLLFPALVAIAVPRESIYWWSVLAFVFSLLLVVWGNMSPRWQELNAYIERWFLRGTPLLISLFVMVIAILRLFDFSYVSTLLDAIPFGSVFGLVLMNYVLFWLAEYWMSRAAAFELLRVLSDAVQDETHIEYRPTFIQASHPDVLVDVNHRYLASHATGRFVALGDLLFPTQQPCPAFQAYYLTETFALIDGDGDSERVAEIVQRTGTYFLGLNFALFIVALAFGLCAWFHQGETDIKPVVSESAAQTAPSQLVDLSSMLQQPTMPPALEPVRPAIVVVGSGGGTRAALYTASVLRGLHRLNADQDIVLVSGVSGGGVALAYFAANRAVLTGKSLPVTSKLCRSSRSATHSVDDEWDCFTTNVTKPFIEDVVNGMTEWRIFTSTALSELLADSFTRYLFEQRQLGSIKATALILNATIVSHPAGESAVLTQTIDPPKSCDEAEQVFKLMSGGRLVFTNLRDVDAFLRQGPNAALPDVRLPYRIVRDAEVPLAGAAALNANFPPVFPAARVRVRSDKTDKCPNASFYVTDGGTQENLGLISALYALESALEKLKAQGGRARPIHVVIAEASALDYDYAQDRGLSVFLGASRERLAGGLTRELQERVDALLTQVNGAPVRYHFLGLPLAFRSRGGFGTHWLYAEEFHLSDPRPRRAARHVLLPDLGGEKVTVTRKTLEALWSALHDPDPSFCKDGKFDDSQALKVQGWICGLSQAGGGPRDLHMDAWEALVRELRKP